MQLILSTADDLAWGGSQVPSGGPPPSSISSECLPHLSLREQPLLPVLGAFCAGWYAVFKTRIPPAAENDRRVAFCSLGLIVNEISVIEQLVYTNKVIVLQETHCTIIEKLVIANFSLNQS